MRVLAIPLREHSGDILERRACQTYRWTWWRFRRDDPARLLDRLRIDVASWRDLTSASTVQVSTWNPRTTGPVTSPSHLGNLRELRIGCIERTLGGGEGVVELQRALQLASGLRTLQLGERVTPDLIVHPRLDLLVALNTLVIDIGISLYPDRSVPDVVRQLPPTLRELEVRGIGGSWSALLEGVAARLSAEPEWLPRLALVQLDIATTAPDAFEPRGIRLTVRPELDPIDLPQVRRSYRLLSADADSSEPLPRWPGQIDSPKCPCR